MKVVKVLGSGCANCINTAKLIEQVAHELNIEISIEKVTRLEDIMGYDVMSTPSVVVDEQVVHSGGIPTVDAIKSWFQNK